MKTEQEIQKLKDEWLKDPCWHIEDTTGFNEHKQELYIFRLEREHKDIKEELRKDSMQKLVLAINEIAGQLEDIKDILSKKEV